jgi:putative ABC transport system permease protein
VIEDMAKRRWIRLPGVLRLAYKLLVNDKSKFSALLVGITFAAFLMIQMTSMFAGVLKRSSATVSNIGASMWIMDPAVNTVAGAIPLPDYLLNSVRSLPGVRFAVPLFSGGALVKMHSGTYQSVNILGLDDATLFGRPSLQQGNIEDLYADNAFLVVHDSEFRKLENPTIGTEFEINDHRAVVVGIADVASSGLFGVPTLYTTYSRALQYIPTSRFTISYVLVEPTDPESVPAIQRAVARMGYLALTKEEFDLRISNFYKYQTGVGLNLMLMTLISFIVGLSISGQTFYTFILENLDKFGALKAIGAKGRELVYIILFQATFTALTGFGLGVGLCAAVIAMAKLRLPSYAAVITYSNIVLALVMVLVIAGFSSYVGIRKVLKVEPFDIFRG